MLCNSSPGDCFLTQGSGVSGIWPAWVDMRSVFPMHAAGPIICSDPTGRGVSCPSDIQCDKACDKAERAVALLEAKSSKENTA